MARGKVMRWWVGALWGMAALSAVAAALSCRQIVGVEDNPSTSSCGLPYGTATCAACAQANCCAQSNLCAGDLQCKAYASCLGPCAGDPACRSQCAQEQSAGGTSFGPALSACLASKCEASCGLVCGGLAANWSLPDASAACQKDIQGSACSVAEHCAFSSDCQAAVDLCGGACRSYDCVQDCWVEHGAYEAGTATPEGAFGAFVTAWRGVSLGDCASGNNWACVGNFSWPTVQSSTTTLSVKVVNFGDMTSPVEGLAVSLCGTDPTCSDPPPPMATTNSDGIATFRRPLPPVGSQGFTGFLQIVSPTMSYVPERFYWGFPITQSSVALYVSVGTPALSQALTASLPGLTQDSSKGQIVAIVGDCLFNPSAGAKVTSDSSDPETTVHYGLVTPDASSTDTTALVFINNAPVRVDLQLTATPQGTDQPSSRTTVQAQAGWITVAYMYPTP